LGNCKIAANRRNIDDREFGGPTHSSLELKLPSLYLVCTKVTHNRCEEHACPSSYDERHPAGRSKKELFKRTGHLLISYGLPYAPHAGTEENYEEKSEKEETDSTALWRGGRRGCWREERYTESEEEEP
jgi:hypothetical protein